MTLEELYRLGHTKVRLPEWTEAAYVELLPTTRKDRFGEVAYTWDLERSPEPTTVMAYTLTGNRWEPQQTDPKEVTG